MFNRFWNELGLKRWFYFALTLLAFSLLVYGAMSIIAGGSSIQPTSSLPYLAVGWGLGGKPLNKGDVIIAFVVLAISLFIGLFIWHP